MPTSLITTPQLIQPVYNPVIYVITNIVTNKIYIGSAIDVNIRWSKHKSDLRLNKHHSILLQRAYNKYGEHSFTYEVLEYVTDVKLLSASEQKWLDFFKPEYNILNTAYNSTGYKHSAETKAILSEKHLRKVDQFDKYGDFIRTFNGVHQAQNELNISHISDVCRGTAKTAGGFIWKYHNKENINN